MTATTDGFKIASADLDMRGPGDFMGTSQHGFPEFKAGDIIKDIKLIELAKETAAAIISEDKELKMEKYEKLKTIFNGTGSHISKIIRVG